MVFAGVACVAGCGGSTIDMATGMMPGASGGPYFTNPIELNAVQAASINQVGFNAVATFNDWNRAPAMAAPTGSASYDGAMLVQLGEDESYLQGGISISVDMATGIGNGSVEGLYLTGRDIAEDGLTGFGDGLSMSVEVSGNGQLTGRIFGSFSDDIFLNDPFVEENSVEATYDAQFVDTGGLRGLAGVIDGTISSATYGVKDVGGVMVAEEFGF